jgi:hypothetical protein
VARQLALSVTHTIGHSAPWRQELAQDPRTRVKVFRHSRADVQPGRDPECGFRLSYGGDLPGGHEAECLPRRRPFRPREVMTRCA